MSQDANQKQKRFHEWRGSVEVESREQEVRKRERREEKEWSRTKGILAAKSDNDIADADWKQKRQQTEKKLQKTRKEKEQGEEEQETKS